MKTEFLKELGLEQDAIDAIMAENGKDIEKAKKPGEAATERVAELEAQLAEVGEKLKAFDGVDVEGLNGQIASLTADMAAKDSEWQQKLADRDFTDLLHGEITTAKGINAKAVAALLDLDALKGSKNQKEDIAAAIAALKESDPNQFESDKPQVQIVAPSTSGSIGDKDEFQKRLEKYKR